MDSVTFPLPGVCGRVLSSYCNDFDRTHAFLAGLLHGNETFARMRRQRFGNARVRDDCRIEYAIRLSSVACYMKEALRFLNNVISQWKRREDLTDYEKHLYGNCAYNAYLAGGCAAYIVGRTDEFGDVDVFVFGLIPETLGLTCMFSPLYQTKVFDFQSENGKRVIQFIFLETFRDVERVRYTVQTQFDFSFMSLWISMHEPLTEIWTAECECDYENRCIVVNTDDSDVFLNNRAGQLYQTSSIVRSRSKCNVGTRSARNDRIVYPFLYEGLIENMKFDPCKELYCNTVFDNHEKRCTFVKKKLTIGGANVRQSADRVLMDRFFKLHSTKYGKLTSLDLRRFDIRMTRHVKNQSENLRLYSRFKYWRNKTIARFVKYAIRLKTLHSTTRFRPLMYVYDTECNKCIYRRMLTLKFFNLWYNKTFMK